MAKPSIAKICTNRNVSAEDRFWNFAIIENGCWKWSGYRKRDGYGQLNINGKMVSAHRFSYELHNRAIPKGLCCLHRCDNPECTNPKHLFLGTHAENMADRNSKGRQASQRGESHGCAKLSEIEVLEIKKKLKDGQVQRIIAAEYGVSSAAIGMISSGKNWAHLQFGDCR